MVQVRGVEPLIPRGRRILSPMHMPVLPYLHIDKSYKNAEFYGKSDVLWSGIWDSNPWPPGPKPGALVKLS